MTRGRAAPRGLTTRPATSRPPNATGPPMRSAGASSSHLAHPDWITTLTRHGFTVTGLHELARARRGEATGHEWLTPEWARRGLSRLRRAARPFFRRPPQRCDSAGSVRRHVLRHRACARGEGEKRPLA